jgi:hypothetical protein
VGRCAVRGGDRDGSQARLGERGSPPYLFVVSRYAAQFVGNEPYDEKAAWMGWGDLMRVMPQSTCDADKNMLGELAMDFRGGRQRATTKSEPQTAVFEYPTLTIEVRVH